MLHLDKKLFTDTILATAEYFSILPGYIEKDYWITRTLRLLSENNNAHQVGKQWGQKTMGSPQVRPH